MLLNRDSGTDIVFVIDEISGLVAAHDTSVALMEAGQQRGHRILVTTAAQLEFDAGAAVACCHPVTLRPAVLHDGKWIADPEWYALGDPVRYRLGDAAAVFMRTDPPVDAEYLRATYLLDLVDPHTTLVLNSPAGVRNANEKLFALRVPQLGPPTLVSADRQRIRSTVSAWGRAVLKPTDWMGGHGILVLDSADPNLASLLETATETLICLPASVIETGTDITPSTLLVSPMAPSMPARSLPTTCTAPLTTTCGV